MTHRYVVFCHPFQVALGLRTHKSHATTQILKERNIKHMSFWSYVKKCQKANQRTIKALAAPPQLGVTVPCPSGKHSPFPASICTRCQPPPITLGLQPFRMVDHVEFEHSALMERFIAGWRNTGIQRFAYLFGRYERYDTVPCGIKAVVCWIWEPAAQQGAPDGFEVGDVREEEVHMLRIMQLFGLQKLGMIYTDLVDDGSSQGSVICKRHADSYFVSSGEVLALAQFQLAHPYRTKYAEAGEFGSRFVTVIVSGGYPFVCVRCSV
jgi:nuclear protein localization protein 4 homolog